MRVKKYEAKIRKAILKYSLASIILMLIVVVFILGFYNRALREHRLQNTLTDYNTIVTETIAAYNNNFFSKDNDLLLRYLSGEVTESNVYQSFNTFNGQQNIKGDLIIYDTDLNPLLTTAKIYEENVALENYLNIVLRNSEVDQSEIIVRVYKGLDYEMYALILKPIKVGLEPLGYSVSMINGKEFLNHWDEDSAHFAIIDQFKNVLSSSNRAVINDQNKLIDSKFVKNQIFTNEYLYKMYPINQNITIYSFVYAKYQTYIFSFAILFIILFFAIIIGQSYLFSKKTSRSIGNSLYILQNELNDIQMGDNEYISINSDDEYEDLADKINIILSDLRASHEENIVLNQQYLKSEKKKLEAQFNPHFLANTLETIRSAMYFDLKTSDSMIQDLNHILRYSIDESIVNSTQEEDLTYLKHYLSIHKTRHEDFDYNLYCDPALKTLYIPKLFLLPLIENSIKYGFKHRKDLKIKISIIKHNDEVIFRVMDNGNVLDKQEAIELNQTLNESNEIKNQHGLRNTKQRIAMLYPDSTFKIFKKMSCTIVEIRIKGAKYV